MYIPRTLIRSKGTKEEKAIREDELVSSGRVIVLLGEPGIGKTELTKQLAASLGASRVGAGTPDSRSINLLCYPKWWSLSSSKEMRIAHHATLPRS